MFYATPSRYELFALRRIKECGIKVPYHTFFLFLRIIDVVVTIRFWNEKSRAAFFHFQFYVVSPNYFIEVDDAIHLRITYGEEISARLLSIVNWPPLCLVPTEVTAFVPSRVPKEEPPFQTVHLVEYRRYGSLPLKCCVGR